MLIIGRKNREGKNRIVIDERIVITVVKLRAGVVRLRISSLGKEPIAMRKEDEKIIGDSISIKILTVGPVNVKIGIEAPEAFGIRRGELSRNKTLVKE